MYKKLFTLRLLHPVTLSSSLLIFSDFSLLTRGNTVNYNDAVIIQQNKTTLPMLIVCHISRCKIKEEKYKKTVDSISAMSRKLMMYEVQDNRKIGQLYIT